MRRIIDVFLASVGLVMLIPIMLLIGFSIFLSSGTPVLFRQVRVGRNCKPFVLIKFRTMTNARDNSGCLLGDSQRTTRLGRLLRRFRIDELPELWNIITGEMSFIGPRPLLETSFATQGSAGRVRATVRPGLTGWAQINGNTLLSDEEKLALDLWYTENVSLAIDLKILVKTFETLLFGERIDQIELRRARESYHHRCG